MGLSCGLCVILGKYCYVQYRLALLCQCIFLLLQDDIEEATSESLQEGFASNSNWVKQFLELASHSHQTVPPNPEAST